MEGKANWVKTPSHLAFMQSESPMTVRAAVTRVPTHYSP